MNERYENEVKEYTHWIQSFGNDRLTRWKNLLQSNPESALCEAMTCQLLINNGCSVEPFEDLSSGGVDFKCIKNQQEFFVEVTCISQEKVTDKTKLADDINAGATYYRPLTKVFWNELCRKVSQCSGLNAPCIVVFGTYHFRGGCLCFNDRKAEEILTGKPYIAMAFDPNKGKAVGEPYQETDLESAAFLRPIKKEQGKGIEYARNPISAVLLCPFGTSRPNIVGVLHPNPNFLFDRKLLPKVKFGKLKEGYKTTGILQVEWI